jgi:hypothetical protein
VPSPAPTAPLTICRFVAPPWGLTKGGEPDMMDREILAQSARKSAKLLPRYVKKTMKQITAPESIGRQEQTEVNCQNDQQRAVSE